MSGKYRTLVADPPWDVRRLESPSLGGPRRPFGASPRSLKSIALSYPTLGLDEIKALPVASLADHEGAHLYLWTVNAYVEQAYSVARSWGFKPSTLLTWCKPPMGLGPGGAFSITTEYVLFCRRGSLKPCKRMDSTWWAWSRRQHSAKPEAFTDMVEQVSPPPYVELFARRQRLGWDTWGNQAFNTAGFEVTA